MTVFDLIFEYLVTDDMELVAKERYDYYGIMPDDKFILMKDKGFIKDIQSFLEEITDDEDIYFRKLEGDFCVDYSKLEFLRSITIEGNMPTEEPCQRNQLIAIRGTCDHNCPQCVEQYDGYVLRELPSCDRNLVGTTVWTSKWATFDDFIFDIFMWMRQCKGLDVLIINFDFTPIPCEPELNFEYIAASVLIQGSVIKFLSDKDEIQKLYKKYAKTYECTDYIIEESISSPREKFYFSFEKPEGCKK